MTEGIKSKENGQLPLDLVKFDAFELGQIKSGLVKIIPHNPPTTVEFFGFPRILPSRYQYWYNPPACCPH
jgi:hypothetical protein